MTDARVARDGYQLARVREAELDLGLAVKDEFDRGNIRLSAYRVIEEARKDLAEALEKLAGQ